MNGETSEQAHVKKKVNTLLYDTTHLLFTYQQHSIPNKSKSIRVRVPVPGTNNHNQES
jgi:hypothetical protein